VIRIHPSPTADTRTCDFTQVTKEQLYTSSVQHIGDVNKGFLFFMDMLVAASKRHDHDKLSDIDGFHRDFTGGFKSTIWWDNHRKVNRHHLMQEDGIPSDVNLVDVIDMVVDCVMAGMARSGSVYDLNLPPELLQQAFKNTVDLLKQNVEVVPWVLPSTKSPELISSVELVMRLAKNWAVVGKGSGTAFCSVKKNGEEFEVYIREI
jgi:hypothetical protein